MMYWPVARTDDRKRELFGDKLWTYDACTTMEEAQMVFFRWANDCRYHIIKAWVDVYDGSQKVDTVVYYEDHDACVRADEIAEIIPPPEPVADVPTEAERIASMESVAKHGNVLASDYPVV